MPDGPPPDPGPPGPSATGGPGVARPAPLLAAAGLGILLGAYCLMYSLVLFTAARVDGVLAVFGAVYLGIALLCGGGAVQALTGRGTGLLASGGGVVAALAALGFLTSLAGGGVALWPVVLVAAGVGVVVLLNRPASRAHLALRRTR